MEYVNLIDYVGKPELIQHVSRGDVLAVVHIPESDDDNSVLVVFQKGTTNRYFKDGRTTEASRQWFILRPKPKKKVKGYRKAVLFEGGGISNTSNYQPTKEIFEKILKGHTLLGEWQEVEYEVNDD